MSGTQTLPDDAVTTAEVAIAGRLRDGTEIKAITLTNARGISARILNYGATLQSLIMPDWDGAMADVVLGHDDVGDYEQTRAYLGVTIGRYANRIAGGRFALDTADYPLSQNEGIHTLHGGEQGFDLAVWKIESVSTATASAVLSHISPDGEAGFPGELRATVTYALSGAGDLTIDFAATTTRPTVINMTNHSLFNLGGSGAPSDSMQHLLMIAARAYTPVDAQLIPTGEQRPVAASPFDFLLLRNIGAGLRDGGDPQIALAHGYDHNFVLDKGATIEPQFAARLEDPISGRCLDVLTTEPGLQLYTANGFDGSICGKQGRLYRMGDGVALEPQKFPDTPNRPAFGSARIDPGQTYRHAVIFRLSARLPAPGPLIYKERGPNALQP